MEASGREPDAVGMKAITSARRIAEATPPSRNRYIDFLRAASILVVVFGHWLMATPYLAAGGTLNWEASSTASPPCRR